MNFEDAFEKSFVNAIENVIQENAIQENPGML